MTVTLQLLLAVAAAAAAQSSPALAPTTARVVRSLSTAEKSATVAYLQSLQNPDGGFGPAGASELGNTSAAVRALRLLGAKAKDAVAAAKYMSQCFSVAEAAFGPRPQAPVDVRSTAIALMGLEVFGAINPKQISGAVTFMEKNSKSFEDLRISVAALEAIKQKPKKAEAWTAEIKKNQNDDGTFGTGGRAARDTGSAVVALLRLGAKLTHSENILTTLKEGQQADGGFSPDGKVGGDLETSYRIMRAFHLLKSKPEVGRLRAFVKSCRNADGGYAVAPGRASSASGTYFALTILSWLE